jgi:hypothetical protein
MLLQTDDENLRGKQNLSACFRNEKKASDVL